MLATVSFRHLIVLFISSLALLSCIDVEEEIWIHDDSSSKISMDITIPLSGKRKLQKSLAQLKAVAEKTDGASMNGPHITTTSDRRANAAFDLEFSSVFAAKRFSENLPSSSPDDEDSPANALIGEFSVSVDRLAARIDRQIFTTELLPLKNTTAQVAERNRKLLNGATLNYILHLPNAPIDSNAQVTEDGGKTLKWSFLLADHLDKDASIQYTWRPVIPWWAWIAMVILLALLTVIVIKLIKLLAKLVKGRSERRNQSGIS